MTINEINPEDTIRNDYKIPKNELDGVYTKTTLFMLHAIDLNMYRPLIQKYFVNAFVDDKGFSHKFIRPIFVLFKIKSFDDNDWDKIYEDFRARKNYILDYECGIQDNHHLVMVVFQCLDDFREDYYRFKRGKYSEFSKVYKSKFFKTVPDEFGKHVPSTAYGAINKDSWLKNQLAKVIGSTISEINDLPEIWSIPRKNREYYRYVEEENKQ